MENACTLYQVESTESRATFCRDCWVLNQHSSGCGEQPCTIVSDIVWSSLLCCCPAR
jgi:hypothetical protein